VSEHEEQSEEYRRGYHAGFIQGVESLLSLARPDARRRALAGAWCAANPCPATRDAKNC